MRVTQRMAETLVVEDAPDRLFGWMLLGFGLFGVLVAGAQGANWLFGIVGTVFVLFGLWKLVVARTITHRFDAVSFQAGTHRAECGSMVISSPKVRQRPNAISQWRHECETSPGSRCFPVWRC